MNFASKALKIEFFGERKPLKIEIVFGDGSSKAEYKVCGLASKQMYVAGRNRFTKGQKVLFKLTLDEKDHVLEGQGLITAQQEKDGGPFRPVGACLEIVELSIEDRSIYNDYFEEMLTNQTVADMMQTTLLTVTQDCTLAVAVDKMNASKVGSVVVLNENGDFAGIFTERDVLKHATRLDFAKEKLSDFMTSEAITLEPEAPLEEARKIFGDGTFRHLPIVKDKKIFGILSTRDTTQHALEILDIRLNRLTYDYELTQGLLIHDLRSPIASIKTLNFMLLGSEEDKKMFFGAEFQKSIANRCDHMLALINDLLEISQISIGKAVIDRKMETNLGERLISSVTAFHGKASAKNIELKHEIEPDFPTAYVDLKRVDQILENLLSNAIKFSNEGDSVMIRLESDKENILISVSDTGQGIPEDEIADIFKEFSKISVRPTGGEDSSGLGLAIVKRIVEAHDGSVRVESKIGEGTTFYVTLPLSPANIEV